MLKNKKVWMIMLMTVMMLVLSLNASAAFSVRKENVSTPTSLTVGSAFTVKGKITSTEIMNRVVVSIIKGTKQIQRYEAKPYSVTYDLSNADSAMLFDKLPAGEYIYRISAFNKADAKCAVVNKTFTVKAAGKISISNPSPSKAFTLKQGGYMTVGGKITSNYKIVSVTAKIINANGKVVQSKTVKPNTTVYNMTTNKTIDNAMSFNKLSAGTYKFQVSVKDSIGTTKLVINRKCTITVPTPTGGNAGYNNGQYSNTTQTIASPKGFSPRTTVPTRPNKYYYDANYNIYYKYNSLAPTRKQYYSGHYVTGNCTWYACGRAMEIVAKKKGASAISSVQAIFGGDPVGIFKMNQKLKKFKYGKTPKPGALAVFNYGGNSGDAHISVVEAVINGVPYVSESGYTVSTTRPNVKRSNIVFWYQSIYAWSGARSLLGYIYLI